MALAVFCLVFAAPNASASRADALKKKILEQKNGINGIEKEIAEYQGVIDKTRRKADSLKNQIKLLDATAKKLNLKIRLTKKKIKKSALNIESFYLQIEDKESDIADKRRFLAEVIKKINEADGESLAEILLSGDAFSDFFGDLNRLNEFQDEINVSLREMKGLKKDIIERRKNENIEKNNLENLKSELVDQKKLVGINKNSKNAILKETKNKESNYRKILARKKKLREKFEKELREFESKLRIEIDPGSLPPSGSGVLSWPLDKVHITQKFGRTVDSRRLYASGSHNGVDFRASMGTRVLASADGVVMGVGNTDKTCPRASFGRWILIDHENGLAATYAHLSLIKVSAGQKVKRGQVIGYSGNSGYTTGPHLHLSVYARQGVNIETRPSKACVGRTYTLPLAPIEAYLDPLEYL